MQKANSIIIHCSDSNWGCMREIDFWHKAKGWKSIGYHFVILNGKPLSDLFLAPLNGSIECGRPLDGDAFIEDNEIGSHALGYNSDSIGICLIGKNDFTPSQMASLRSLLRALMSQYNISADNILGHNETESGKAQGKTCPNFSVKQLREDLGRAIIGK